MVQNIYYLLVSGNYVYGRADRSLSEFPEETVRQLLELIEEVPEEDFYNHDAYSYVYDHHGRAWDKIDAKDGDLNHRIFFRKIDGTVYILDIFPREELDYEERGLYNRLQGLVREREG